MIKPKSGKKNKVRPVSEADRISFINAILDPAYGVLQKLEVIQKSLIKFMITIHHHDEAPGFLSNLKSSDQFS